MTLAAGTRLGPYEVHSLIGAGGMGEVYKARDTRLDRTVAVKLIASHLTSDEGRRERFLQEARLAAAVDHPHLAAIYDIDRFGDRTFIAMEYVHGQSLRRLLAAAPLKLRRAIDLALEIGDALAKVHEHGVVHRDVKPENVIVSDDGYAKLIDFGLAKLVETAPEADAAFVPTRTNQHVRTADGVVLGTSEYMSPEQARGEKVNARTDIFSFGLLLHEMLSGKAPFRRSSIAETVSAILTDNVPPLALDDVPVVHEVQRVIRKCLVKDPAGRYQTMRDVVVDLREIRDSIASGAQTAATPARRSRGISRRLVATIGAIVLIAASVALAMYLLSRPSVPSLAAGRSGRPALAILPFENVTGPSDTAWLSAGLPSMLLTGLTQTPDIEVVGLDRLNDAAQQLGFDTLEKLGRAQLRKVAERAGAKVSVSGSIAQAGGQVRIDARVEELASGRVVFADSVQGANVMTLADELSAKIRRGLDVRSSGAIRPVSEVTSSSVAAYELYSQAAEAYGNFRQKDAINATQKALDLDPDFVAARVLLVRVLTWAGRTDEARTHLERAAALLGRLGEVDRTYVLATQAQQQGRVTEAAGLCEKLLERYPETEWAYRCLAAPYTHWAPAEDSDKVAAIYARGVEALPSSADLRNMYSYALMDAARYDEAIHELKTLVALRPKEMNSYDSLADGYLVAGDITNALVQFDRAIAAGSNNGGRLWTLAIVGRYDEALTEAVHPFSREFLVLPTGQYREAMTAAIEREKRSASLQDPQVRAALGLYTAATALNYGVCAEAVKASERAIRTVSSVPDFYRRKWVMVSDLLAGTCEARNGQPERARARLARRGDFETSHSPTERWWFGALKGEIALAVRDAPGAAAAFVAAEPSRKLAFSKSAGIGHWISFFANELPMRDGLARAKAAQGMTDEAIAEYRKLLTPGRESKWTARLDPRHVLALARLLGRAGRKDEARKQYRRFLDLWMHADPDRPELAEARSALSR